jgi:hypothetical protein
MQQKRQWRKWITNYLLFISAECNISHSNFVSKHNIHNVILKCGPSQKPVFTWGIFEVLWNNQASQWKSSGNLEKIQGP